MCFRSADFIATWSGWNYRASPSLIALFLWHLVNGIGIHSHQVQIDNLDRVDKERIAFVCHAESGGIFPVNWCKEHGFSITPPKGKKYAHQEEVENEH